MAGLVPAIHVFSAATRKDVNARHKAGHDESLARAVGFYTAATAELLRRNPTYCSSAKTPVATACTATMISPSRLGVTSAENSRAKLASVHATLPASTIAAHIRGMVCRVPSQPTSAA